MTQRRSENETPPWLEGVASGPSAVACDADGPDHCLAVKTEWLRAITGRGLSLAWQARLAEALDRAFDSVGCESEIRVVWLLEAWLTQARRKPSTLWWMPTTLWQAWFDLLIAPVMLCLTPGWAQTMLDSAASMPQGGIDG